MKKILNRRINICLIMPELQMSDLQENVNIGHVQIDLCMFMVYLRRVREKKICEEDSEEIPMKKRKMNERN